MTKAIRLFLCLLCVLGSAFAQTVDDARSELRKGNPAEAKRQLEALLKNDAKNAEAHYWLGITLLRREVLDLDEAVDHMEEAVDLNPDNADYHYGLGAALGTKAQSANPLKQAWLAPQIKNAFAKAVELNPNHINARGGLADFYQMAPGIMGGDDEKAWEQADAILKLDEFTGRAKRALMFSRDKKVDEAEKELKTLTTNLPKDWRGWKSLGYFYIRNNRPAECIVPFQNYVDLRPDTADSFDSLAEGQVQNKDYEQATANLKKALALDENFIASVSRLAHVYELKGQKKEAREAYQRALTLVTNPERRTDIEKKLKELQ
ncbi:MAG TPA: tetratricopeptide repeat protein [Bacteroidota bacterium]